MIIGNMGVCMDVKPELEDLKKFYQEKMDNAKETRDDMLQEIIYGLKTIVDSDKEYDEYEQKLRHLIYVMENEDDE